MENEVKERVIQVFLSQSMSPGPGIYEVSTTEEHEFSCTCPGFEGRKSCKHIRFVKSRVDSNKGAYPLEISSKATKEEADKAQESPEAFRAFILKYGKVEVC
jgi:hypothetical protein